MAKEGKDPLIGGQALIEGVMMMGPSAVGIAVRSPDGNILRERWERVPPNKRGLWWKIPLVRGLLSLGETLYWGVKALDYSARVAEPEAKQSKWEGILMWGMLGLFVLLFVFIPVRIAQFVVPSSEHFVFNLVVGVIKVIFVLGYIASINLIPDIRRVFAYHGAEHKVVFAFENGDQLSCDTVMNYPRKHPRCGTSFLFVLVFFAVIVFVLVDSWVFHGGQVGVVMRALVHLLLMPLIIGISYEMIRWSSKSRLGRIFACPGLLLQVLTTREPSCEQIEVAVEALKEALHGTA